MQLKSEIAQNPITNQNRVNAQNNIYKIKLHSQILL